MDSVVSKHDSTFVFPLLGSELAVFLHTDVEQCSKMCMYTNGSEFVASFSLCVPVFPDGSLVPRSTPVVCVSQFGSFIVDGGLGSGIGFPIFAWDRHGNEVVPSY